MNIVTVLGLGEEGVRILQYLADGMVYSQIAADMKTSEQVIKNSVKKIREKLGADTTAQAVAMGLRRNIID